MGDWRDARAAAEALDKELTRLGFPTVVYKTGGHQHHPCIKVSSGRWSLVDRTEYVYVAPDENTGVLWFWGSSLEPVAPATEVSNAAGSVARTLAAIPRAGIRVV